MRTSTLRRSIAALAALGLGCTTASAPLPEAQQDEARTVTVLYFADLHAQLEPHLELFWRGGVERREVAGGVARLAAAVAAIRRERPGAVLLLDAGDTLQGSGAAALSEGAAVVPALNALGVDAAVPGNWEVVYGPEALRRRARELAHPLVAANLRDAGTGARVFPPYVVREVGGVRVGVLGFTDPDVPRRQPPGYSQGLVYDGPEELPALVRELREKERADVVLLLSHVGLPKAVDLAGRVPGVDVHLSGDTHERTYEPIERAGAWVVEPGAFGSFLGRLDLTVRGGEVVDRRWQLLELTAERFPAEDPAVLRAVERSLAPFRERLARPIGRTDTPLERYSVLETTLDDVLADAVREAAGTEVALSNGFRFSPPIAAGPITEADLWNAYPVVARLRVGRVTGRALRAFWERELENVFARDPTKRFGGWLPRPSGMTVRFAAAAEPGRRVLDLRVGGVPVEDDRTYTIAACEREGDPPDVLCRIPGVADARTLDVDAHEAVRRYLAARPTVRAAIEGRVVAVDLPPVLRTQM